LPTLPIKIYQRIRTAQVRIAVETLFGNNTFVSFGLIAKHLLFYSGGVINLGIEALPTKIM